MQTMRAALVVLAMATMTAPAAHAAMKCGEVALGPDKTSTAISGSMFTLDNRGPSPVTLKTTANEVVGRFPPGGGEQAFFGDSRYKYVAVLDDASASAKLKVCH